MTRSHWIFNINYLTSFAETRLKMYPARLDMASRSYEESTGEPMSADFEIITKCLVTAIQYKTLRRRFWIVIADSWYRFIGVSKINSNFLEIRSLSGHCNNYFFALKRYNPSIVEKTSVHNKVLAFPQSASMLEKHFHSDFIWTSLNAETYDKNVRNEKFICLDDASRMC